MLQFYFRLVSTVARESPKLLVAVRIRRRKPEFIGCPGHAYRRGWEYEYVKLIYVGSRGGDNRQTMVLVV